jgi:3-hydroxy-D-aspartate aldolase
LSGKRVVQDRGPNAKLIGQKGSRNRLATPALVLDLDAMERNIARLAQMSRDSGLRVRPHAKTHKSAKIAKLQIDAGALGVCVATLHEATCLAERGIADIHITTPIIGEVKIEALFDLASRLKHISVVVDNAANLESLENAASRARLRLRVLVDVDLGAMYRTGVQSEAAAIALAERLARSQFLEFVGIQFYSGIVQHIATFPERQLIYGRELERLSSLLHNLRSRGLEAQVVSGGGTGTFSIDAASGLFTENQSGSYVVMDVEYAAVELHPPGTPPLENALFVLASVVSNNAAGLATIDAGSKCFAMDGPLPRIVGSTSTASSYQFFGDEFGMILSEAVANRMSAQPDPKASPYERFHQLFGGALSNSQPLEVGAKIELVVPHCDPTVNLHDFYHCVRGDTLVDIWPVDARGSL